MKNSVLVNHVILRTAPSSSIGGLAMFLTGVRSGLNRARDPSVKPTVSCLPFGDHPTAHAFISTVFTSILLSFSKMMERVPGEVATAILLGIIGFHAMPCTRDPPTRLMAVLANGDWLADSCTKLRHS